MPAKAKTKRAGGATPTASSKTARARLQRGKKSAPSKGAKKMTRKRVPATSKPTKAPARALAPAKVVAAAPAAAAHVGGGKRGRFVQKGRGVVDVHSGKSDTCHVYDDGVTLFQFTLNQTNIKRNNNKFYIVQLLEDDISGKLFVYTRWGRVGHIGSDCLQPHAGIQDAMEEFCGKFYKKTANHWLDRHHFKKVPLKYEYMDINYGKADEAKRAKGPAAKKGKPEKTITSKLPEPVQELMRLISCRATMDQVVRELEVDTARMPLGKISKVQILRAFGVLKKIENNLGKRREQLVDLSSQFYTLIPHSFGMQRPPVIDTKEMVNQKKKMLETLNELEIASKLLGGIKDNEAHPLDNVYDKIKCEIQPLKPSSKVYKRIIKYVENTQGPTHRSYTLKVTQVFTLKREGEEERYAPFKRMSNRRMLWHGSPVTNFLGILSQGLRIAPPEAPSTGYMFGKGIYLSDVCSKSANYCRPSSNNGNTGLLLLCEVALGRQRMYNNACYMLKPQEGSDSTKGIGRFYPDPGEAETVSDVMWPNGRIREDVDTTSSLIYPEYIIYDVNQCVLRYLVQVTFEYK
uniref:Poly [ADP-ribose] polymerase n=1 Tax=Trypanosoma congolense (strain IL3000) TaxID=1068625 RepID=G0ULU8_TRYCI|nr:unnamed protein product [Trypanosoma congolense IL3000]